MNVHAFGRSRRRGSFDMVDLLLVLLFGGLLIAIFLPSGPRSRVSSKRAVCASNLRGIAQGMHIYANENLGWFPNHYYDANKEQAGTPRETGVRWVGTMGSNDFLKISEATHAQKSPDRSHPSRSLFLLIIGGHSTPGQFFCPFDDSDIEDNLRNHGPDATDGGSQAAQPGRNRFDFRGYNSLSYGYQLPYSTCARPNSELDVRMPIAADKGPYHTAGGDGLPGSKTTRDARSEIQPPVNWSQGDPKSILGRANDEWRPYNSRNHAGEGQNVVFVDGHADYCRTPIVGVHNDNLYTLASSVSSGPAGWIGIVPSADETYGPLTQTDSFIVP